MLIAAGFQQRVDIRYPLSPIGLMLIGPAVLFAGASYCMGYSVLSGGTNEWARAIGWSAGAVLPWLIIFELIKRSRPLAWPVILGLLVVTGLFSLGIEAAVDRWIWDVAPAPVPLQILRRLPAIGVVLLLLAFPPGNRSPEDEIDPSPLPATGLRFVRAADNYVELHREGRMEMLRETLARTERRLANQGFVRVHRSILVHPREVMRIEQGVRTPVLILADGTRLPTGERYSGALRHFVP